MFSEPLLLLLVLSLLSLLTNSFPVQYTSTVPKDSFRKERSVHFTFMASPSGDFDVASSSTRRLAIQSIMGRGLATFAFVSFESTSASALDMDAFINAEVNP